MRAWRWPSWVVLLLMTACATSHPAGSASLDLHIEQLPEAGFNVERNGALSVAYQMSVVNRSADAITLRKIEMRTVGRSPYKLRNEPAMLNETVEPGKDALVTFTMWRSRREAGPMGRGLVSLEGNLTYDNAKGTFKQPFSHSFREP